MNLQFLMRNMYELMAEPDFLAEGFGAPLQAASQLEPYQPEKKRAQIRVREHFSPAGFGKVSTLFFRNFFQNCFEI